MRLLVVGLTLLAMSVSWLESASGGEMLRRYWCRWKALYRTNEIWPEPWLQPDRIAARAPFDVMVAQGWQEQNTLTDDHFMPNSAELSETGRLKVADILINSPPQFRTIFIERTFEGPSTAARMKAVQQFAARRLPEAGEIAVSETIRRRYGTSGEYTDTVLRQFQESQPVPRLPANSGATTNFTSGSGS